MVDLSQIRTTLDSTINTQNSANSNATLIPLTVDDELSPKEKQEIENLKANREMRLEYAERAYYFAKNTLIGWAILVFLYVIVPEKDKIMDIKMFGVITTACTVNILVAFHAVIKGLFSTSK